ncbi:NnrS family protein [Shewanella sp. MR-4]|uniref:NnrS family protein n=1 Tax=Shewanella sp. (strain MR-7) TaxID=60481 RepID=Q0HTS5_SHESR|nr:NnrS family protein [Shewanella sp. MR-4]ABI39496.1 NnrS family protein [Shewanella sp. MR-4]
MLNIDEPAHLQPKVALFRLGFRPFFLFASLFSLLSLSIWGGLLSGKLLLPNTLNPLWWHGHEMIFGFVCAVVAGFLLTAVQNWTGRPGVKGLPLAGLFMVWLLPRLLLILPFNIPLAVIMAIDLLFLPLTATLLAISVIEVRQWRNFVFIPILGLLTIFNGMSYYGLTTNQLNWMNNGLYAAVILLAVIVALLGGRVIPFFTERATNWQKQTPIAAVELLSFASLLALVVSLFLVDTLLTRILAGIAGLVLLFRWSRWGWRASWSVPLLWSLHLSYLCIPIGLMLIAAGLPLSVGMHAITVGGLGGMILAMMSRVSLGHTGRSLTPPRPMALAFALILLATVLRVLAGLLSAWFIELMLAAIGFWILAFGCFCYCYAPMLCRVRVDGRPG